jgi:hypothetical protein
MKHLYITLILLALCLATIAQGLLTASTEIPVMVELAPALEVVSTPAVLDYGRIDLGIPAILSTVHVKSGNAPTSLWCSIIDGPGGWTLGSEQGADIYAIKVNDIPMTSEPQEVYKWVGAYQDASVHFMYYAPLTDTFGAHVDQGYKMRIEARESLNPIDPGEPPVGGD